MKTILREISAWAIQLSESAFTDEQKRSEWLGNPPASEEEIKLAESRLGIEFPNDYRSFLLTTNSFFTPNDSTEPTFETVDKIDHLKNIDPFLLEIWNEGPLIDIGVQLNRAVVIGGINDEQYFFLIPPDTSNSKWQYWKFANWIPGEERYENLDNYFQSVLNFMKDISQKDN